MPGGEDPNTTRLLVVADGQRAADDVYAWIGEHASIDGVVQVTGFYAAVAALTAQAPLIVMDAALSAPRDEWQLAGLRAHLAGTTVVVVGDEPRCSALAGAVRADLCAANTRLLPPLRELMLGPTLGAATIDLSDRPTSSTVESNRPGQPSG